MKSILAGKSPLALFMFCVITLVLAAPAFSYNQYSQDGDNTYCATCHGDFRSGAYISPVDGQDWGNIHNLHRSDMLSGDCDACHSESFFPVSLSTSFGGSGLEAIGCMGCHGRAEDNVPANPSFPNGSGAGLRQHHFNAGVTGCLGCHDDSDPANYTPVGEEVLPPYYANPGTGHDAIPAESCNSDGSENFAGASYGLDNDGDLLHDGDDPGCNLSNVVPGTSNLAVLMQNHPNPFNPTTSIRYRVENAGQVRLQVLGLDGRAVRTLVNSYHGEPGSHVAAWDGKDEKGQPLPSGVFFYRLDYPGGMEMKKMILLK